MPMTLRWPRRRRRPRATVRAAALAVLLANLPGFALAAGPAGPGITAADTSSVEGPVASMVRAYAADYGSLDRFYSAPHSPVRNERFRAFYRSWMAAVDSLDFERLARADRIDAVLLRHTAEYQLSQIDIAERRFAEILPLMPFAPALIALEDDRRALRPVDAESTAALLTRTNGAVAAARARVDSLARGGKPGISKAVANRAVRAVGEVRRTLAGWFEYRDGYDPVFSWWTRAPYRALDSALDDYASFVRERLVGVKPDDRTTIIGDPIGRDALVAELRHAMIPYTPEELVDIANKEMAWCEGEMVKASRELGFGDDWKKALEHVKNLHREPGEQPALIADLAREAVEFVESRGLVTVPPLAKATWRMEMLTPEQQLASPFFLGGEAILVSFPTDGMGHEQKMMSMRGNNPHFARATVHHELIPGHHLQGFMNDRYRSYRWPFATPFWTEGWALYWEMLLWDKGFARGPEDRVGMLFWRMHRSARIVFSLGFHLGTMTPAECVDYLTERVGHERDNATAEVRRSFRGDYGPLYQCAYLLGGLQFRALHREFVESGAMTDRDFHDAVLKNNAMPVVMVRALLSDAPPERGAPPEWRFYDR